MYPLKKHKNLTIKWDGGWGVNCQGTPEINKEFVFAFFLILYGGITKLLQFLSLALTHGWLDFHPPILGQMVGNPTNPRWNIHPMDGFPSSGWNSIHTGWISNRMDGNPTIRPSWPRCSGAPSANILAFNKFFRYIVDPYL